MLNENLTGELKCNGKQGKFNDLKWKRTIEIEHLLAKVKTNSVNS